MGAQLGSSGGFSDINMTPLIDIVLVVLIIMMVNIPIQIEQMGVKLPRTTNKPPPDRPTEQLVIALYDDDQVALNREVMAEDEIQFELMRRLRPMAEKRVFVDAHPDADYGRVVDMVDVAYAAGAAKVGLAKLKDEGPKSPTSIRQGSGMARGLYFSSPIVATDGGDIDAVKADAALQALKPQLVSCYAQRLGARPDLTGTYSIEVEIGPDGALLSEPEVRSDSVKDLDLRDCIKAVLPKLAYAPLGPQKTAAVRYSILFSPG